MKNKKIILFLIITAIISTLGACTKNIESGSDISLSNNNTKILTSDSVSSIPVEYYPIEWAPSISSEPESWDDLAKDPLPKREIGKVIDVIQVDGIGKDQMPSITNETPLYELMSGINPLTVMAITANCDVRHVATPYHLSQVIDHFPVSFLRKIDEGCYYTVNKLIDGGYVYIFFERERDTETGKYITEDPTEVFATGCLYAEQKMEKSDFNNVKIGDSIEKVISIDHAAFMTKQWADWNDTLSEERSSVLLSKHLLTDGILWIVYSYNGNDLVVSSLEYSPEFIFRSPYILEFEGIEYPKLFKILPQDYPPES